MGQNLGERVSNQLKSMEGFQAAMETALNMPMPDDLQARVIYLNAALTDHGDPNSSFSFHSEKVRQQAMEHRDYVQRILHNVIGKEPL